MLRRRLLPGPGAPDDERWVLTLILLLVIYFLGSVATGRLARVGVVGLMIILVYEIVQVDRLDRRLRVLNLISVTVLALMTAVEAAVDHEVAQGLQSAALALAFGSASVAVGSRVVTHPVVTFQTVVGALDIYILLAFTFAGVYSTVDAWTGEFFAQVDDPHIGDFFYFSNVTITTVGFGDLTPATPLARSLTTIEALLGQIFMVTAVARLVSLVGQERPERPERRERPRRRPRRGAAEAAGDPNGDVDEAPDA